MKKTTMKQGAMDKQEIKAALGNTLRRLLAGEIRPDVCDAASRNIREQTTLMIAEITHAKGRGEMPFVPELLATPAETSGRILGLIGRQ